METKIVIGCDWGYENKGRVVQWLCKKAIKEGKHPIVIRPSGDSLNPRTVFYKNLEHHCYLFGSGVLQGVPTVLGNNFHLNPIKLMEEYDTLVKKGVNPIIYINKLCNIVTPYDPIYKSESMMYTEKDPSIAYYERLLYFHCLESLEDWLEDPKRLLDELREYYKCLPLKLEDEKFVKACNRMKDLKDNIIIIDRDVPKGYSNEVCIFECAYGLLRDISYGLPPKTTYTDTGLRGILYPHLKDSEVYLVAQPHKVIGIKERGNFLDIDLMNRAIDRHHLDTCVIRYNLKMNLVLITKELFSEIDPYIYLDYMGAKLRFEKLTIDSCIKDTATLLNIPFEHIYHYDHPKENIREIDYSLLVK